MKPKVIFIGNYKGGVGKTTSVLNFAIHFSRHQKKILTIDLDPQSSLSEILVNNNSNDPMTLKDLDDKKTLNYVFDIYIAKIKKYNNIPLTSNSRVF